MLSFLLYLFSITHMYIHFEITSNVIKRLLILRISRIVYTLNAFANQNMFYFCPKTVAHIDEALKTAQGSAVQCLYKIESDIRKRADEASEVIISCVYEKISASKDLLENIFSLVEKSRAPLDSSIAELKACAGTTSNQSSFLDKMNTATCLVTVS